MDYLLAALVLLVLGVAFGILGGALLYFVFAVGNSRWRVLLPFVAVGLLALYWVATILVHSLGAVGFSALVLVVAAILLLVYLRRRESAARHHAPR